MFSSADILQIANVVGPIVVLLFLLCFEACSSYPMSSSRNVWNVPPFSTALPKQLNLVPRTCRLTVQFSGIYAALYTECKYGRPLGQPWSSCAQERLVRAQEFCFDGAIESIDMVCFELLLRWAPPRDFTLTGTTFTFQKIFSQRKLRIHAIRRGDGKHFTAKVQVQVQVVASLALEEMTLESIWMKEF